MQDFTCNTSIFTPWLDLSTTSTVNKILLFYIKIVPVVGCVMSGSTCPGGHWQDAVQLGPLKGLGNPSLGTPSQGNEENINQCSITITVVGVHILVDGSSKITKIILQRGMKRGIFTRSYDLRSILALYMVSTVHMLHSERSMSTAVASVLHHTEFYTQNTNILVVLRA